MNPATNTFRPQDDDDPRLVDAAQVYLAELESGRRPRRHDFLARYPDLADQLTPYLDAIDMVHSGARLLPASGSKPVVDPALPVEPLGDFRIVREIGRGGMGTVYEAVQLSLGRRVALKVLPFAAALDSKQLQRFKNEAQAAALLHHSNIVPVYAVGSARGVHYYAMQLIEGQNLADLIAQLRPREQAPEQGRSVARALTGRPSDSQAATRRGSPADLGLARTTGPASPPALAPPAAPTVSAVAAELSTQRASRSESFYRSAARLVAQAADALEHAHQFGIIHRDIKPANLMVDARANVWVTDFGLALFHTAVGLTRTGDLLGTLRYMSPEQAGGQQLPVDPRTDIYSLGATLYELLTLEPLFDGTDHQRLLRQILEDEPRAPRTVAPAIPPELETIVLKAVSKTPADRYSSAQEFGDDLRRFLDNMPIRARKPTMSQRARKWARRHPSVVWAGMVVLVLLTVGSLGSAALIQGERANTEKVNKDLEKANKNLIEEEARTKAAAEGQRQRAELAERRLKLARQSVDELIEVSEGWLAQLPHLEGLRRQLLTKALTAYQEFIDQRSDDPKAQEELRDTKLKVEKILGDLAALEGAGQLPLLGEPAIQDDLHLSDEQRSKVRLVKERIEKQRAEGASEFVKLSEEERRKRSQAEAYGIDRELSGILSDQQLRRLPQIALQLQGPGAFRQADVVAALGLTADQREKIRTIENGTFDFPPMGEHRGGPPGRPGEGGGPGPGGPPPGHPGEGGGLGPRPPGGPSPDERRKGWEEWQKNHARRLKEANEKILGLLSADQLRHWKELTGEPFKGSVSFMPWGGPMVMHP